MKEEGDKRVRMGETGNERRKVQMVFGTENHKSCEVRGDEGRDQWSQRDKGRKEGRRAGMVHLQWRVRFIKLPQLCQCKCAI